MLRHRIAALLLAASMAAPATASDKDPLDYSLRQYGAILAVALIGGFVSWLAKVRAGTLRGFNVLHLIGELATSAFAGLMMFWVCEWAGAPKLLTICLVGIFGHMGTRGIALLESWAEKRFGDLAGEQKAPPT